MCDVGREKNENISRDFALLISNSLTHRDVDSFISHKNTQQQPIQINRIFFSIGLFSISIGRFDQTTMEH